MDVVLISDPSNCRYDPATFRGEGLFGDQELKSRIGKSGFTWISNHLNDVGTWIPD